MQMIFKGTRFYSSFGESERPTLKANRTDHVSQGEKGMFSQIWKSAEYKHHQKKEVWLQKEQQVLEVQVPDNAQSSNLKHPHFKHRANHHKDVASKLGFHDSIPAQTTKNTNDVQQDNEEKLDIVIKKTSHKDPFGNKLEQIHSDADKITVSKVASISPFQEIPGIENYNGFLPPEQISDSRNDINSVEYEPYNQEFDRTNPIFNSQNGYYEDIQGSNKFIDKPEVLFPPEINNNDQLGEMNNPSLNDFSDINGHVQDVSFKYSNGNPGDLNPSVDNRFIDNPHVLFPAENGNNNQFDETYKPQLNNFPDINGHVPDTYSKHSNGNPESLNPYNGNGFIDKPHVLFPSEISNNNQFDETDKSLMNSIPETHGHFPDMSLQYSNGHSDSLNPPEGNAGNGFLDKPHVLFPPENENNLPYEDMDKSYMNHFPETNEHVPDASANNYNVNPESMIPPQHEMAPHSHIGETVHEVFKKEEKIQEIDSQSGNKEVSREISRKTSNTVSKKLSEDSNSLMGSQLTASHPQDISDESMNYRSEDENPEENYPLHSPAMKIPESFEHDYEESKRFSSLSKRDDMNGYESQRNHQLNRNPYDRSNYNGSLIPKSIMTQRRNLDEIKNLPTGLRAMKNRPTDVQEMNYQPINLEKMKNHPIDFGEIKNYPYVKIHKGNNKQNLNRNKFLDIFFSQDTQQRPEAREIKQPDMRNIGDSISKNFIKFKREGSQFERNSISAQNADKETTTNNNTPDSQTEETEKRSGAIKRLPNASELSDKKNLLYIRKRTVEILLPNIPSKNNESRTAEFQKLQLNNPFLKNDKNQMEYQLRNGGRNHPYPPNNQKYAESEVFGNSDAFRDSRQYSVPETISEHLNFAEQTTNPEELDPFLYESIPRKQNGDQFNVPHRQYFEKEGQNSESLDSFLYESFPRKQNGNQFNAPHREQNANSETLDSILYESIPRKQNRDRFNVPHRENSGNHPSVNIYTEEEEKVERRETPTNIESIISEILDASSNKIKRNASSPRINDAKAFKPKTKKKSHKRIHKKKKHHK
ncbi:hypothetical protein HNY73_003641 [Argiope bruennichi]|uniref:Uncharacterized protein n=1 Tax=Argiope bruennichi TaxID=94029 RepID=A0A8T0FLA3_ARGBR|nr:hypothetical protein HNY73_003641 [Argiope bruennichi]